MLWWTYVVLTGCFRFKAGSLEWHCFFKRKHLQTGISRSIVNSSSSSSSLAVAAGMEWDDADLSQTPAADCLTHLALALEQVIHDRPALFALGWKTSISCAYTNDQCTHHQVVCVVCWKGAEEDRTGHATVPYRTEAEIV